jgi:hypothetical protein
MSILIGSKRGFAAGEYYAVEEVQVKEECSH